MTYTDFTKELTLARHAATLTYCDLTKELTFDRHVAALIYCDLTLELTFDSHAAAVTYCYVTQELTFDRHVAALTYCDFTQESTFDRRVAALTYCDHTGVTFNHHVTGVQLHLVRLQDPSHHNFPPLQGGGGRHQVRDDVIQAHMDGDAGLLLLPLHAPPGG